MLGLSSGSKFLRHLGAIILAVSRLTIDLANEDSGCECFLVSELCDTVTYIAESMNLLYFSMLCDRIDFQVLA